MDNPNSGKIKLDFVSNFSTLLPWKISSTKIGYCQIISIRWRFPNIAQSSLFYLSEEGYFINLLTWKTCKKSLPHQVWNQIIFGQLKIQLCMRVEPFPTWAKNLCWANFCKSEIYFYVCLISCPSTHDVVLASWVQFMVSSFLWFQTFFSAE